MSRSSALPKPAPTLESLAEHLRDGPLTCLTALQDHAEALAKQQPAGSHELLEHLQSLVALAQCCMTRFYDFTADLRTLIDRVTLESTLDTADPH